MNTHLLFAAWTAAAATIAGPAAAADVDVGANLARGPMLLSLLRF